MKNRDKILNRLKRYKQNKLRKKPEQEKNKFCVSSGVSDFGLISDKKEQEPSKKENPLEISSQNINIEEKPVKNYYLKQPDRMFH